MTIRTFADVMPSALHALAWPLNGHGKRVGPGDKVAEHIVRNSIACRSHLLA